MLRPKDSDNVKLMHVAWYILLIWPLKRPGLAGGALIC